MSDFTPLVKGTPDWHEKYNADFETVLASLSNKVNANNGYLGNATAELDTATTPGVYTWIDTSAIFGMDGALYNLAVEAPIYGVNVSIVQTLSCTFHQNNTGRTLKRTYYLGMGWTPWTPIATATLPQEFDLPLAAGNSGSGFFRKNQFNEVTITFKIFKDSAYKTNEVIATLPEGFRANRTQEYPVVLYPPHVPTIVNIGTDGTLKLGFVSETQTAIYGHMTILAP